MPVRIRITQFDMTLDKACWQHLGTDDSRYVDQALALNRDLAALGPFLPLGTELLLPDIETELPQLTVQRLWGAD